MRQSPPPNPTGWYALAFSDELAPGALLTRPFAGGEVVLWRATSGRAVASDPYCPHLGAHLGHGGEVVGEAIRCPFHHFRFDTDGRCVQGYPGHKAPPACRLPGRHLREQDGLILVWHGEGAPTFEVPALDQDGWRPLVHDSWNLAGHPQETSENSVDLGHFGVVHGYTDVRELVPAHVDGPLLHARYHMARAARGLVPATRSEFELFVWGLGYSVVDVTVHSHGLRVRTFVLPCPAESGRIDLRLATQLHRVGTPSERGGALHRLARIAPLAALEWVLERRLFAGYAEDVRQDFEVWRHKTWLEQPALASGDGPIALYRRWVRQFYPDRELRLLAR